MGVSCDGAGSAFPVTHAKIAVRGALTVIAGRASLPIVAGAASVTFSKRGAYSILVEDEIA